MALPVPVASGAPVTSTDHNALIPQILLVREEQPANTGGGTMTASTWTKRPLNTVALNEITGASLSSNVITLPAGVYNVEIWAMGYAVALHKARLRQTSGTATDLLIGSSEQSTAVSLVSNASRMRGRITLTTSTTLEVQHNCTTTRANSGMGTPVNLGVNEVYGEAIFTKVG